jgi:DNA polymerase-4
MEPGDVATILHADLDAFYASVEQLLDPTLRARPIAVGGGVVLAASYEARACGVRGGMSAWRARQLCPELLVVGGHFEEYQRLADRFVDVLRDFTPVVERVSIDEAFLDVAGAVHLFGPPGRIAGAIRHRVRTEIGLPVSVGVARTKHLAKVASQVAKPDGLIVVAPTEERAFLDPLPVELMWGVGPATRQRLSEAGIRTIGELSAADGVLLEHLLGGAAGRTLGSLARNTDPRSVEAARRASSIGAQAALGRRRATTALVRQTVGYLADRVGGRLRAAGAGARTVTVRVRFAGMRSVTRSVSVPVAVSATLTLTELAAELVHGALADHPAEREVTLLAVSLSNLADEPALQLELPLALGDELRRPGTGAGAARWVVDRSVDAVRTRFGRAAVGYGTVVFSDVGGVPEAFRELAERDHGRSPAAPPRPTRRAPGPPGPGPV